MPQIKNRIGVFLKNHWLILALFSIFFLIRVYRLGGRDFWFDEIGSLSYAEHPWQNWNAPFYWIILHLWTRLFGFSELSLRLPSAIFNFLSVVFVYKMGKVIFNRQVAIFAAALIGLSAFHLWYAQEARDYSAVLFFGTFSSYLLLRALNSKKIIWWVSFALFSLCGVYTNYFYLFLLFSQLAYIFYSQEDKILARQIVPFFIIFFGFSLYLNRFLEKFYFIGNGFWIPKPGWEAPAITFANFILGYNGLPVFYPLVILATVLVFLSALRSLNKGGGGGPAVAFCGFLFILPLLAIFIFSRAFFSIYLNRCLILFSPYFYLFFSFGVFALGKKIRFLAIAAMLVLTLSADFFYFSDRMFMGLDYHLGSYTKKPVKPLVKFLQVNVAAKDLIAFTNDAVLGPARYYGREKLPELLFFFDPKIPDSSWGRMIQENQFTIPHHKVEHLNFERLWVIYSGWERDGSLDENSLSVMKSLGMALKLEGRYLIDGSYVFVYRKSPAQGD
ncbi:MAG: glycosyltransferase family 39 protein [Candidatus Omnitrophica bacterium]|nr:glycosyltransferase family 39 protein [Candidatus Omnitrophota bacterium]MDD5512450.1 glycosyltransferase family 39 protein [Candidatus Omnitrophota bacterium]